jgi:hypothetical protein
VDEELSDVPVCTWPGGVEYRPLPGWPRYRVGENRSVWVNDTPAGRPPPWDKPRWRRLKPKIRAGQSPSVELSQAGKKCSRSVELLFRAAFDPGSLSAPELARVGPERPPAKRRRIIAVPPPALPLPIATAGDPDRHKGHKEPPPLVEDDDNGNGYARGSRSGRARLDEDKVVEARRLHAEGLSTNALAARYGVGRVTMHYALVGKTWGHVPMHTPIGADV